ncbi:MAG: ABC transporter permease [Clostridia bacterium]|nr:ABC transporter permease [Clostridia bacterium]
MKNKLRSMAKSNAFQSIVASLLCIVIGLVIGFIVLLIIKPDGAWKGITDLLKNFFNRPNGRLTLKYLGNTLVKTAPLIMCSLSILFCYKVGLFNIGAAGQYCIGVGVSLYAALAWGLPWWLCMLLALIAGGLLGAIIGLLKAYCNVNEVISGIMFNWISLYAVNMLLTTVKESTSPYTVDISRKSIRSMLPSAGLDKLFSDNRYVTIAIPLAIIIAVAVYIILDKTKFGYELKATGFNKNAAKYAGMAEKRNIIVTIAIGGALAALGASMFYLTGYEQWHCSLSSVPSMGFNGIAAAFLGGLNPIGCLLSSFFIQHITEGGAYVDKMTYSSEISDLISSIIIYLCGFVLFIKFMMNKSIARSEEKRAASGHREPMPGTDTAVVVEESGKGGDE